MTTIKVNDIELSTAEAALVMALIKSTRRQAMASAVPGTHKHDDTRFEATVYLNDDQIDTLGQIINYTLNN